MSPRSLFLLADMLARHGAEAKVEGGALYVRYDSEIWEPVAPTLDAALEWLREWRP